MRFHLMMLLFVILVSLGMHGMASAMPSPAPAWQLDRGVAADPAART